jgi:hypothetical protein
VNNAPGADLLEKARLELRRGETANARRLAEEAFSGPYNLRGEAEAVLRSVDAEEFNQRVLVARKSFDAGASAYQRREYAQAGSILRGVDVNLLEPERQGKYRELMQMRELQPQTMTLASARGGSSTALPGTARATDARGTVPAACPPTRCCKLPTTPSSCVASSRAIARRMPSCVGGSRRGSGSMGSSTCATTLWPSRLP